MIQEDRKTGLVLKELSYRDGKEKVFPAIDFTTVKRIKIRKSIFSKEVEVEFH